MKNCQKLYVFTFSILVMGLTSVSVFAEDSERDVKQYVICRNQKVVRTIRVECQGQECDTIYMKDGNDRVEGSNNNVLGGQKILGNIQANLEKAAWKCNDVTANAKIAE